MNCRFWRDGKCKRFPPVSHIWGFPIMDPGQWCGEWQHRSSAVPMPGERASIMTLEELDEAIDRKLKKNGYR